MSGNSHSGRLRVAVVVESLTVPEWVAWTVARIDAAEAFELTAVLPATGARCAVGPRRLQSLTYQMYEWLDSRVFGPAGAMRDADLTPISSGRTTLEGVDSLDVVVSFVPADRVAWHGAPPRHGVWVIVPMDDGRPTSAPSRFWEVSGRTGAAATAVAAVGEGVTGVIAEGAGRADPLSLARTRHAAAWASAHLVLRSLRSLHVQGQWVPARAELAPARGLPSPAATVRHVASTALRGVAARSRTAWRRGEWFVAVGARAADGRIEGSLRVLPNPVGRYLADPFLIEVAGRHYLFAEDYSHTARRAVISVSEAGTDDSWSPPRTVLERDHHLSYPFVFEHEGAIYMLPETGEAGRIELHRAVEFPDHWTLDRVLLDGLTAVDATLHVEDGVLWLFANVIEGPEDPGQLWLFTAPSLDAEWRPHPQNPIVTGWASARPAGRLYKRGGALIRPSQDCSRRYGGAVILNRVDVLSPEEYRESPLDRIEPNWMPGIDGTHTYTFDSRYTCLDGHRQVRRLPNRRSSNALPGERWPSSVGSS